MLVYLCTCAYCSTVCICTHTHTHTSQRTVHVLHRGDDAGLCVSMSSSVVTLSRQPPRPLLVHQVIHASSTSARSCPRTTCVHISHSAMDAIAPYGHEAVRTGGRVDWRTAWHMHAPQNGLYTTNAFTFIQCLYIHEHAYEPRTVIAIAAKNDARSFALRYLSTTHTGLPGCADARHMGKRQASEGGMVWGLGRQVNLQTTAILLQSGRSNPGTERATSDRQHAHGSTYHPCVCLSTSITTCNHMQPHGNASRPIGSATTESMETGVARIGHPHGHGHGHG